MICALIVAVFQSSVWALYIGLGLLAITFNVYFISGKIKFALHHTYYFQAIILGHGIGWFFALLIAHLFKRCARNSQPGDSIMKETGRAGQPITTGEFVLWFFSVIFEK